MSLAEFIDQESQRPYQPCSVGDLLASLPAEDAQELVEALAGKAPGAAIERALKRLYPDLDVPGQGTIQRHRKGVCRCGR